jgi:hypothetical protein
VRPVAVLIFHAAASADAGPLVRALAEARHALAERQRDAFLAAGADTVEIVAGPPDGLSFGERLAATVGAGRVATSTDVAGRRTTPHSASRWSGGLVVMGSGSIPLARAAELRRFVDVAAGPGGRALANNRYSADVVAISRAADLADLPPLPADNALPRWLEERAGVAVADLGTHWRLGVDIDTPLDLILLRDPTAASLAAGPLIGEHPGEGPGKLPGAGPLFGERLAERLAAMSEVLSNRRAELLVAGRVSAATLTWLQHGVACRVRALVEERGLRAASRLATAGGAGNLRPPRSTLGELLDHRDGPEALARTVAGLADAAIVDTRVLMAHRFGAVESDWPPAEDRFGSDLLLAERVTDPWLAALTRSASTSAAPILLGGHTLVNGGLRLLAQRARVGRR